MTEKNIITLANRLTTVAGMPRIDDAPVQHDAGPELMSAVEKALLGGETHYTVRPGVPELRRSMALAIARAGGPEPDADDPMDNVLITSSVAESLFVVLLALHLQSGEVVVSSAGACRHETLFHLMGLRATAEPAQETCLSYRSRRDDRSYHERIHAISKERTLPDVLDLESSLGSSSLDGFPPFDQSLTFVTGDLDAIKGLSTFRVAYLMGAKTTIARCRPWKQALSICSAAPSQRAAIHALRSEAKGGTK
jgi:aspartate/methionine/tyrosine aminotransferase